eukprot:TRINITY_DN104111_c0_g1_i1.p1 TRINITY_DN104111_c0_g1~~TRINITY_DN104111_c0_g1_i1.p1  ORF type:complete len:376 (+),score=63.92 TRINITY_DN104111_c0_g1_i1:63-1190(+)
MVCLLAADGLDAQGGGSGGATSSRASRRWSGLNEPANCALLLAGVAVPLAAGAYMMHAAFTSTPSAGCRPGRAESRALPRPQGVVFLQLCLLNPSGGKRAVVSSAPTAAVATKWERLRGGLGVAGVLVCGIAAAFGVASRLRRSRRHAEQAADAGEQGAAGEPIPEDYKAAGVIFFTRDPDNKEVSSLLLGIEERKVPLRDLGEGSGSAKRSVLLFPQGKRETYDKGYLDTARREFVEETDDPTGLASYLEKLLKAGKEWWRESSPVLPRPTWFQAAKLAVVYCEVEAPEMDKLTEAMEKRSKHCKFPLRPVWVNATQLRKALNSPNPGFEVVTKVGPFPVFPLHRRFFRMPEVRRWLEMARVPVLQSKSNKKRR